MREAGRHGGSLLRVHSALLRNPVTNIARTAETSGLVPNTVAACMKELESLGLVREITGKRRNRVFAYMPYLDVLSQGT